MMTKIFPILLITLDIGEMPCLNQCQQKHLPQMFQDVANAMKSYMLAISVTNTLSLTWISIVVAESIFVINAGSCFAMRMFGIPNALQM